MTAIASRRRCCASWTGRRSQPSRLQSLDGEDAQRLLSAYRESLRAGEFETLFPCSPTTWSGPRKATARSAASIGKSALIDLFSRLMDYSRNTLRILEVGAPEPRAAAMPLRFQVQDGPGLQESGATHTLRLRANVITRVNSVADDPAGDARPKRPRTPMPAQVRHAAWRLGLPADQARRRYIALVRRLDADA